MTSGVPQIEICGFVVFYCFSDFKTITLYTQKNLKQSPKYKVKVNPAPQGLASKAITEDYPLCILANKNPSAGNCFVESIL